MAFLLSCRGLTRSFGSRPLFRGINLGIETGERIGVVGPNGSGKTTLLAILAGLETADTGEISGRRDLRVCYVAQSDEFDEGVSPRMALIDAMEGQGLDLHEREHRADLMLARLGMPEGTPADALSGGWRKRLAIARQIVREPDLLLLDEPTNHLDLEGILWLERTLQSAPYAVMAISHDRRFLETFASRILEVNPMYPEGVYTVAGNYSKFLEEREARFQVLSGTESALNVKVRREIEWLRQGAQARSTKAQGRIDQAMRMIDDLDDARDRARMDRSAGIELSGSGRKTRELLVARRLSGGVGGRTLFTGLDLVLSPGNRLGVVGSNGSGKTTLLRTLIGALAPLSGEVRQAPDLKVAYFDQLRAALDPEISLKDALSPNGDNVIYRGRSVHVAGWAKRFLFDTARLEQPVRTLSGGEQSRVLIANLMLQPADILVMDEPTNDLDIPTLEVLEESLCEFPGAVVLVTHDRYLLDRVCDRLMVLGEGAVRFVADTFQWEQSLRGPSAEPADRAPAAARPRPVRLNTSERKELEAMEETILAAEERVAELEGMLEDPGVGRDAARLAECWEALGPARERVAYLYGRWQELEEKKAGSRA